MPPHLNTGNSNSNDRTLKIPGTDDEREGDVLSGNYWNGKSSGGCRKATVVKKKSAFKLLIIVKCLFVFFQCYCDWKWIKDSFKYLSVLHGFMFSLAGSCEGFQTCPGWFNVFYYTFIPILWIWILYGHTQYNMEYWDTDQVKLCQVNQHSNSSCEESRFKVFHQILN